jgi:hypothetical protein
MCVLGVCVGGVCWGCIIFVRCIRVYTHFYTGCNSCTIYPI